MLSGGPRLSQTDELALRAALSGTKVEICVTRDPSSRYCCPGNKDAFPSPPPGRPFPTGSAYSRTGVLALLPHKDVQRLPSTEEEDRREEDAVRPGQVVSGAFAARGSVGGDPAGRGRRVWRLRPGPGCGGRSETRGRETAKWLRAADCEGMGRLGLQLGSMRISGVLMEMAGRVEPRLEPLLMRRPSCPW